MAELRVRDIMTAQVVYLRRQQSLSMARELMQLGRVRHLPVLDDEGKIAGLVTHRDLLEASLSSLSPLSDEERDLVQLRVPISSIMRSEVWSVDADAPALSAARLMVDNKIGCVLATERGKLVGIVTEADLLGECIELLQRQAAVSRPAPFRPSSLRHLMTPAPQVIEASQPLRIAETLMRRLGIRHLPVTIASQLHGLLSERDVAVAMVLVADPNTTLVGQVVERPALAVDVDARPDAVAFDVANDPQGAALVIDGGQLIGIITTTDLVRELGRTLTARWAGTGAV